MEHFRTFPLLSSPILWLDDQQLDFLIPTGINLANGLSRDAPHVGAFLPSVANSRIEDRIFIVFDKHPQSIEEPVLHQQ